MNSRNALFLFLPFLFARGDSSAYILPGKQQVVEERQTENFRPAAIGLALENTFAVVSAAGRSAASLLPRLLSGFVEVTQAPCSTDVSGFEGATCLGFNECLDAGGSATTSCAMGFGTCCIIRQSCGETSSALIHYFTNPSFPKIDTSVSGGTCQLTILPCDDKICQIKVDFVEVELEGPDAASSVCHTDSISITGNGANIAKIPTLCGILTGEHVYINVEPSCSPTYVNIDVNLAVTASRKFNLKITKIPCNSPDLVPNGCLRYYNSTSGLVKSFNSVSSHLIAGQNHAACIATQPGFCSITWKQHQNHWSLPPPENCGGYQCCYSSYLLIPGATCTGVAFGSYCAIKDPRFCDAAFATNSSYEVISWHRPFIIYTYVPQPLASSYKGYILEYMLNRCSS